MVEKPLNITQVNLHDSRGGAAAVSKNLHKGYKKRGLGAILVVARKIGNEPDVVLMPSSNGNSILSSITDEFLRRLQTYNGRFHGSRTLSKMLQIIGQPKRFIDIFKGIEDFNYPGSWRLLEIGKKRPGIVHCHNLHPGYFDLRVLPWLSHQVPVLLTLHDAWLFTGHCAHSLDCHLWKIGCKSCPDLSIYPSIRRDACAVNWMRKKEIYSKSKLYIAAPSAWIMKRAKKSMLAPAIIESQVIPNGIDLSIFKFADKQAAKKKMRINKETKVILFSAVGFRQNIYKDFKTVHTAITLVAKQLQNNDLLFLALGDDSEDERIENTTVRFIAYQKNPEVVASYYQAADIYVHAARADTFPTSILEALACGTPIVATSVGGIPEQVKSLDIISKIRTVPSYSSKDATGILVQKEDYRAIADGILKLLDNDTLRLQLGRNAVADVKNRFSLSKQIDAYIDWYHQIVNKSNKRY